MDQTQITASPVELQAISDLLQRAPTTISEKIFIEAILNRWFTQSARGRQMQESTGVPAPTNHDEPQATPETPQEPESGDPASM